MKLIFIYGEPGVGKLTVAKELAKLTGYKIFHNHLTVDLIAPIIPFEVGSQEYLGVIHKVRLDLIEIAAKSGTEGLIVTSVYGGEVDHRFLRGVIARVRKHGGRVMFVRLYCDEAELRRRIKNPSRRAFKKITRLKTLQSVREKFNLKSKIPFVDSLEIDNTKLSPRKTASLIKKHYNLI